MCCQGSSCSSNVCSCTDSFKMHAVMEDCRGASFSERTQTLRRCVPRTSNFRVLLTILKAFHYNHTQKDALHYTTYNVARQTSFFYVDLTTGFPRITNKTYYDEPEVCFQQEPMKPHLLTLGTFAIQGTFTLNGYSQSYYILNKSLKHCINYPFQAFHSDFTSHVYLFWPINKVKRWSLHVRY